MKAARSFVLVSLRLLLVTSFFTSALLLLFSPLPAADLVGWNDLGIYGGQIRAIAIHPVDSNIVFAGSSHGDGLFKSTNAGETWESVGGFRNEIVTAMAFDPVGRTTLWVSTYTSIYRSEDSGLTWTSYRPGSGDGYSNYLSLAIDPHDGNTVYVGTAGHYGSSDAARIYKTTDGGATWTACSLTADHNVFHLAVSAQHHEQVWAVTGSLSENHGSIYFSADGGETWSSPEANLGWLWNVVVSPQDSQTVYVAGQQGLSRTTDGGMTWSKFFLAGSTTCLAVALDPQDSENVYANWGSIFSRSTNGGDSWYTPNSISPLNFFCLTVDPHNPQVLYGGDFRSGVYKSTDGGQTWRPATQGIVGNPINTTAVLPSGRLLVGSQIGLQSNSGSGNWQTLTPDPTYAVVVSPGDENTIFAGLDESLGKSTDFGQTWAHVEVPASQPNSKIVSISFEPQNPEVLYFGVQYGGGTTGEIHKSSDGGQHLSLSASFTDPVNVVKVSPHDPQTVYAGTGLFSGSRSGGGVYKTTNGGGAWIPVAPGLIVNALAFDPQNPDIVYAACGNTAGQFAGVFKTTNGGAAWERKDFGLPANAAIVDIKVNPDGGSTLYAATYQQGLYVSYDGGEYWILLGMSGYSLKDLAITQSSGGSGSAGGAFGLPVSRLYASSNSGFYRFSGSGLGLLSGTISDAQTAAPIDGAAIVAGSGQSVRSLLGFYGLVVPSGVFDLTITAQGYPLTTKRVSLASGESKTLTLTLGQVHSTFTIAGLVSDATGVVSVGTAVKFTAEAQGEGISLYYKFWVASGYGTQSYGNWQVIQDYSTQNFCTWTPASEGNYVVVAWIADDPVSQSYQQAGMSLKTGGFSPQPIQIVSLTSTADHPVHVGAPITFTSHGIGGSGPIEFQYWIYDGAQWQSIQAYSTTNNCTWTPVQAGSYIMVVWASDTQATQDPPLAGWTVTVQ